MFKTLIAASLATALAFGGGATPAMADRNNTLGVIVGITALAAIAAAIAHDNKKSKVITPVRPQRPDIRPHHPGQRPPATSVRPSKTIPGACVFNLDAGWRGQRTQAVSSDCLQDQRIDARMLPSACRMDARHASRHRARNSIYEVKCLQRYGYRVAAHGW